MTAYSHSRLEKFEGCRLEYKYSYIDRIPVERENTVEAFLGGIVHEVLEKLYRDLMHAKLLTCEELLAFYHELWASRWSDNIVVVKEEYGPENYLKMGDKYIRDYYAHYHPFEQGRILGLETSEFLTLDASGQYRYHIRIDRLMDMGDGVYEVHDYKTNRKLPSQESLDEDRQLAMYSLWVRRQFQDFKKVRLVWHFLAFDKEMESFRTREQLEKLRENVLETIHRIETTQDFPATVTSRCAWCLYREICPMWKHEAALESQPDNAYLNDPGVKLVDDYVRIKSELDDHKKLADESLEKIREALIAFSQREGITVVAGSEKKITINETAAWKLPGKNTPEQLELISRLKNLGKLEEVSALDTYALAKILQEEEWDEAALALIRDFAKLEKNYRLSVSRRKQG